MSITGQTPAQIIANHQYRPDPQRLGTRCTHVDCDWFVDAGTSFCDMLDSFGAHVMEALTNAGETIVDLPEVQRPEWYDAEVQIDGPGLNGARVVREGDQVSFLGVPCPIRAEVVPTFAAALLAVHQDAARVAGDGDRRG
ncbi:hypothetical protein M2280_005270 [Prescottella agglutinans]|uniref:Uncharacterized protein n=2 Tax=Prescottella agglutinans TaxID=1644129 RepID=A0ABT6ML00_9NOCA|nr:hypothetical protein [Prescottella agglutinans]